MTEIDPLNPDNRVYCPHSRCYSPWESRCVASCAPGYESLKPCKPNEFLEASRAEEAQLQAEFEHHFEIAIKKYYDRTPEDNA